MKKLIILMVGVTVLFLSCAHTQKSDSYTPNDYSKAKHRYDWEQRGGP